MGKLTEEERRLLSTFTDVGRSVFAISLDGFEDELFRLAKRGMVVGDSKSFKSAWRFHLTPAGRSALKETQDG